MVFNGLDYLDANYPLYMQQPYRFCFLCEDNGKVMAYIQATLIDGGKSLIRQAGRSRLGHHREGYFKMLRSYMTDQMMILCPSADRIVYTALYGDFQKDRVEQGIEGTKLIETRYRRIIRLPPRQSLDDIPHFTNHPIIHRITPYELEAIVEEDRKNGWKIFPAKSFISEWEPMSMIDGVK
ncbi:unnamed protein product, partial [Owenia fusiformis]